MRTKENPLPRRLLLDQKPATWSTARRAPKRWMNHIQADICTICLQSLPLLATQLKLPQVEKDGTLLGDKSCCQLHLRRSACHTADKFNEWMKWMMPIRLYTDTAAIMDHQFPTSATSSCWFPTSKNFSKKLTVKLHWLMLLAPKIVSEFSKKNCDCDRNLLTLEKLQYLHPASFWFFL